jgi:uncharacterized membrane protein YbjE (DUF340 family)
LYWWLHIEFSAKRSINTSISNCFFCIVHFVMLTFRSVLLFAVAGIVLFWTVTAADDDYSDDYSKSINTVNILLFMFFGLALGVVVSQLLSIFGEAIPYTVLVFLLGMLFSTAADSPGSFGDSINQWLGIDAELLLFVFLPPLIFGEAMSLNWYHLKGGFFQSVILAGPGVLIGAALMGALAKGVLPYNWGWNLAMTFGSILSATGTINRCLYLYSLFFYYCFQRHFVFFFISL